MGLGVDEASIAILLFPLQMGFGERLGGADGLLEICAAEDVFFWIFVLRESGGGLANQDGFDEVRLVEDGALGGREIKTFVFAASDENERLVWKAV